MDPKRCRGAVYGTSGATPLSRCAARPRTHVSPPWARSRSYSGWGGYTKCCRSSAKHGRVGEGRVCIVSPAHHAGPVLAHRCDALSSVVWPRGAHAPEYANARNRRPEFPGSPRLFDRGTTAKTASVHGNPSRGPKEARAQGQVQVRPQ